MKRRIFLSLAVSASAISVVAKAQQVQPGAVRIGFIGNSDPQPAAPWLKAFRQGLRDLGWIEGQNVSIEYRWAEGKVDRFPLLAAELVRLKVDIIVVAGILAIRAVQQTTSTIPIVVAVVLIDPVSQGFIESHARPGGNITGLASQYEQIVTKQVQLLSEAIPRLSNLVVLQHATTTPVAARAAASAAETLGLKVRLSRVSQVNEFESVFRAARDDRAQALLVLPSPIFNAHRRVLIKLAASYRLPAFYEFREYVEDGGLMSYGVSLADMYRRAASYVDRILKGAKPGELPVEQASKFEFVINLRAAKALGLTIPQSLLGRADQVIE